MEIEEFTEEEKRILKETPEKVLMKPNKIKVFIMDVKFEGKKIKYVKMSDITKLTLLDK